MFSNNLSTLNFQLSTSLLGLSIVPLPQLIALILGAGGHKSKSDITELLRHNPEADIQPIRDLCRRYRLRGLDSILKELQIDA